MPPAIYLQNTIALIWDFDKTLTHDYMQGPLFAEFQVDPKLFWSEVNALESYYERNELPGGPCRVGKDTVYLNHILTYVKAGTFRDLTNDKLKELGALIELAPGLPEFFDRTRTITSDNPSYIKHDIGVEHYIVSTGLRSMIEGSTLRSHVDGVWACELLPEPAPPGFQDQLPDVASPILSQIGYTIDNTSKTRAIFEINKGVNVSTVEVNSVIPEDQRRVPIQNMIYIADGPSDIPSFSLVNSRGGRTLGVYAPGDNNYNNAAQLEEQGRVQSIAEADYTEGSAADRWLSRAIRQMADRIVRNREQVFTSYGGAPSHIV